jgi:hypothetical protein
MTSLRVASMTPKHLEIFSSMENRRSFSCSDLEALVSKKVNKCITACLIVSLMTCQTVDQAIEQTMFCLHELGTINKSDILNNDVSP